MGNFWAEITRLGESGFLLPLGLLLWIWLLAARAWRAAFVWATAFGLAIVVVTASKIAFLGWGIGIRSLNFTGFSGHTMLAAAMFPALAYLMTAASPRPMRVFTVLSAFLLAALIAVSRVLLDAHSVSEVVAGFMLGAVAALALIAFAPLNARSVPPVWVVVIAAALTLSLSIVHRAPSHQVIVTLALKLSGRERAFRRAPWLARPDAMVHQSLPLETIGVLALPAPCVDTRALDVVLGTPA